MLLAICDGDTLYVPASKDACNWLSFEGSLASCEARLEISTWSRPWLAWREAGFAGVWPKAGSFEIPLRRLFVICIDLSLIDSVDHQFRQAQSAIVGQHLRELLVGK